MTTLIVCRNGDVDEFSGRVGITEGHDRNVDIRCFFDGLGVRARVGDNDQAWFFEGASDVVGEIAGGETSSNGNGTGMGGELEDCTLTVGTS